MTERRSKRLRLSPSMIPDDARRRYLDTLPDDALRQVLCHLSGRPRHNNWHVYVSPRTVLTALDVGGALARTTVMVFRGLGNDEGIQHDFFDLPLIQPLVYRLNIRSLVLNVTSREYELPSLLRGCGVELRELTLNYPHCLSKTVIHAIVTNCTGLTALALKVDGIEGTLSPIWSALGPKLERVYLDAYVSPSDHRTRSILSVPSMLKHCVRLRRVDMDEMQSSIVGVLCALGDRLQEISVNYKESHKPKLWHRVISSCPNLNKVNAKVLGTLGLIEILTLVRSQLRSLTLYSPMPEHSRFHDTISSCTSLSEVHLNVGSLMEEGVSRGLLERLSSIRKFTCNMEYSKSEVKEDVIDVIASVASQLEMISISTYKPIRGKCVGALTKLQHLKRVFFRCNFIKSDKKTSEESAAEVVDRLISCKGLVEIKIEDVNIKGYSSIVRKACAQYKRREFDMFIGGIQYATI